MRCYSCEVILLVLGVLAARFGVRALARTREGNGGFADRKRSAVMPRNSQVLKGTESLNKKEPRTGDVGTLEGSGSRRRHPALESEPRSNRSALKQLDAPDADIFPLWFRDPLRSGATGS